MNRKATVLIVEDSLIVSLHLSKALEANNFQVLGTCDSGEETIEKIEGGMIPDLILMDIMLAGVLDGIETVDAIYQSQRIPVVYLSALSDTTTIRRAKHTTPYGYLIKPIEEQQLVTTIEIALYRFKIEQELHLSEKKYLTTVNGLKDSLILLNEHQQIDFINPAAERMLDLVLSEVKGDDIFNHLPFKNSEAEHWHLPIKDITAYYHKQLELIPNELEIRTQSGQLKTIGDATILPIINAIGNANGTIITFRNISYRVESTRLRIERDRERLKALIDGQEMERARVSRDLHDGIGQLLNAVKFSYHAEIDQKSGSNVSRLIDEAIHETSRISENLLPSKLRNFDLKTCIASLCTSNYLNTKTIINFECNADHLDVELSAKVNIYRIAQEAINNALKYATATMISVQLYKINQSLVLTIEDDGIGFDFETVKKDLAKNHHGLQNMVDRVEIMKGKIDIESSDKLGTIISVEIPYEQSH